MVNITNSSSDLVVTHAVQDKDIVFKGDDGGSAITALTLDMSAGGDLTLGANANIVFPGTNVVSTGANTFDDYEEGAWTPACPNVTVAGSEGKYTKVGRLVTVQGYATWPTTSDTNDIEISGLPFTINNSESGRGGAYITYTTAGSSYLVDGDGLYFLGAKNDTKFFASAADGNTSQDNNEVSAKQFYADGSDDDKMVMDADTKGRLAGGVIDCVGVATGGQGSATAVWQLNGLVYGDGTLATPFA